jgi:predicted component of type VI protein secretion system
MSESYLELPLQFDGVKFKSTNLYDSIVKNVAAIVSTPKGSVTCDPGFGTLQLAPDKPLTELGSIKEELAKTILDAIEQNEPRLAKISVKVHGGPKSDKTGLAPLRLEITADIVATGKAFKVEKKLSEDYYRTPFPGRLG